MVVPLWVEHGVHPPPPPFLWDKGLSLPNFQKKRAWQDLNFERRVAGKEEGNFSQRGCNIYKKNKLKSEIFNDKK